MPRKPSLATILKLVLLVAILAWIISTFPKKDWETLAAQEKDWPLIGLAFLTALTAHLITYWRWQMLVNALDVPLRLIDAIRLGFLGTMLNMISVGAVGGDVFKAIAAARLTQKRRTEIVTSVLVDRAIGLLGLVIVAAISLSLAASLSVNMRWIRTGAAVLSLVGLIGLTLIVLAGHQLPLKSLHRIPWVGHVLYRVANACVVFQGRPWLVLQMLASTLCVHALVTIACCLISNALYTYPPTIAQHFQAIPPAMAAATLPLTPGGVGVQEVAIDRLFQEVKDMPEGFSGLIVAAMYRLILIAIAMIGAIVYFTGGDRRLVDRTASVDRSANSGI